VRSFIESDLSDTDNIVPFENITLINLSICSVLFYFDLFVLINRSIVFANGKMLETGQDLCIAVLNMRCVHMGQLIDL